MPIFINIIEFRKEVIFLYMYLQQQQSLTTVCMISINECSHTTLACMLGN